MDTTTHAAAACAIYDALPRAAQDFLRLSDVELRHWARVPDEQDHDALMQTGCEAGVESTAASARSMERVSRNIAIIENSPRKKPPMIVGL